MIDTKALSKLTVQMVKDKTLQRFLYKYRDVQSPFFPSIFSDAKLWFSKPIDLNDPFDGNIHLLTDSTREQKIEWLKSQGFPITTALIDATLNYDWQTKLNENRAIVLNRKGVLCLSRTPKNSLMWAHYANGGRGVCLTFDVLADPEFFTAPLNVIYPSDYPEYNYFTRKKTPSAIDQLAQVTIAAKSSDWQYEEEVRILKDKFDGFSFSREALTQVIFGPKATDATKQVVRDLLDQNGFIHTRLIQATLPTDSFRYELLPL